jgi:sulfur carrier protein ThiS adenylyltransferase
MLSQQEQLRYSRQILVKSIKKTGQLKLLNATVAIVGIGGLGNPAALYLAAAGVGKLILIDDDQVEITNLARQVLFSEDDCQSSKVQAAVDKLQQQFPDIAFEAIEDRLNSDNIADYLNSADVVLDCSDNLPTRYLINQYCVTQKIPLVIGAATGFDGQHLIVDSSNEQSACYHCLFPADQKQPVQNCQTIGIIGPVLAVIGGMQALSAIKILTNNLAQINQLSLYDGLSNQWQQFKLSKLPHCPVCHKDLES